MNNELGKRIQEYRIKAGISQKELAEKVGGKCTHIAISRYETGYYMPDLKRIKEIANALGCTVADLTD